MKLFTAVLTLTIPIALVATGGL
jgi:hypothetical protein